MTGVTTSSATVVVADDDAVTRLLVSSALEHDGFTVIEACDGQGAIDAFTEFDPDLILMDVEMPGTDGYQACANVRELDGGADLPIVMVTGHDDSESIRRAYQVGATDFIAKPINWSLIGHRLRYILRGARNLQALGISEAENRALIEAIPDRIFIVDAEGVVLKHLSGKTARGIPGVTANSQQRIYDVLPAGSGKDVRYCLKHVLSTGENSAIEFALEVPGKSDAWCESRFVHHGKQKVMVIIRDISERKLAEERIRRLAFFDSLTGLPNRPHFRENMDVALQQAGSRGDICALFNVDLNRFKRINDTLGSATGDAVLMEMAGRFSDFVNRFRNDKVPGSQQPNCGVACFGGNEFALFVAGSSALLDPEEIAEELRKTLAMPLKLKGHEFVVTASVGIATFPDHGDSVEILLKNAESARDEAKRVGSNTCRSYRSSMNSSVTECLNLENELRRALENDELSMYYQPKYDAVSLRHCGAEALLRWFHPKKGDIPPTVFIPIAEESGLIVDIGHWVADKVCQQIASWQYFGVSPGPVAINVSGQEFGLGDPVRTLTDAIRKAQIPASALELEITETVLMSDIRSVIGALHALRDAGFKLAVDDFGTGYSSLRYLQKFPVDVLKIDSSFVRDVERNTDSRAICAAIIALARSLGLKVVGEGVETKWQLEFLKREVCHTVQGFLLSEPLSADAFADKLASQSRLPSTGNRVLQLPSRA